VSIGSYEAPKDLPYAIAKHEMTSHEIPAILIQRTLAQDGRLPLVSFM
jgi:hypothetical protein